MDGRYDSSPRAMTPGGKANDAEGTWESNQLRHNGRWSDEHNNRRGSESVSDTEEGDSVSDDGEHGDEHRPLSRNNNVSSRSAGTVGTTGNDGVSVVSSAYAMDGSMTGTFLGDDDGDTSHRDSSSSDDDGSGHHRRDRRSSTHVHTSSSSNASAFSDGDRGHTTDDDEEDQERRTFAEIMDMVSSIDGDDDEDARHGRAQESSAPRHDDGDGDGDVREREGERTVSFGGASDVDIDEDGGNRGGRGATLPANSSHVMGNPDGADLIADESGSRGSMSSGGHGEATQNWQVQHEEEYHDGAATSSWGRGNDDQEEEHKISIDREGTHEAAGYGHNGDHGHDGDWAGHQQQEQSRTASAGEPPRRRDTDVDEEEEARKTVLSDVNLLTKHLESQRSVENADDATDTYEPFPSIPRQNSMRGGFPRTYCFGLIKDWCDVAIAVGVVSSIAAFVTAVLVIELVL